MYTRSQFVLLQITDTMYVSTIDKQSILIELQKRMVSKLPNS